MVCTDKGHNRRQADDRVRLLVAGNITQKEVYVEQKKSRRGSGKISENFAEERDLLITFRSRKVIERNIKK